MSKSIRKQPSLMSFLNRANSTPINKGNETAIKFNISSDDILPSKTNDNIRNAIMADTPEASNVKKSKFVPKKRKASLIEISDDSQSPKKFATETKNFAESAVSDDLFASTDEKIMEVLDDKKIMDDLYSKYASPQKSPEAHTKPQLTSKDKFDLDAALNKDQAYVNAIKQLDKNMEDIQNKQPSPLKLPTVVSRTKTSIGKFKFNKPSSVRLAEESLLSSVPETVIEKPLTTRFGDSSHKISNTLNPMSFHINSKITSNSTIKNSSTVTISDEEDDLNNTIGGFVIASKLVQTERKTLNVDTGYSSSLPSQTSLSPQADTTSPKQQTKTSQFTNLRSYLQELSDHRAFSNQNLSNANEVKRNLEFFESSYLEVMEKYCNIIDSLPMSVYEKAFGDSLDDFLKLKVMKQNIKAKIVLNKKTIHKLKSELGSFSSNNVDDSNFRNIPSLESRNFPQASGATSQNGHTRDSFDDQDEFDLLVENSIDLDNINQISGTSNTTNNFSTSGTRVQSTNDMGNFYSGSRNDGASGEYDGYKFPHSDRLRNAFQFHFGLKTFRPNQLQVINATMMGIDCFVLMPTGGGKSLCYQLPSLLTDKVTIIVSPLKSLILDQVSKLQTLDILARNLSGEQTYSEICTIYSELECSPPKVKLLYITPEKISASTRVQDLLEKLYRNNHIARFVIDEAHAISSWGHDFRPDYKKLGVFRERFPNVPIMALTATATIRVRADIVQQLKLRNCKWFLSSFNRPNLKYMVLPKKGVATIKEIQELIKTKFLKASGIVYCLSRKECDQMAEKLKEVGIQAASYHAGLADKVRETVQKNWITDKFKVVCATIAFGMGIDKPDVRYVFHYSLPKSIEGYYQESGRAGRDGEKSVCILYYNYSDMARIVKLMDSDTSMSYEAKRVHINNLNKIVSYCENVIDCRRALQLNYFAEHFTREQCLAEHASACDNCLNNSKEDGAKFNLIDVTTTCQGIARAVRDLCNGSTQRYTLLHMVDVLLGSNCKKVVMNRHNEHNYYGKLKDWTRTDVQRLLHKLVLDEYLKEELIFCRDIPQAYLKIGLNVEKLMNGQAKIEFAVETKKSRDERFNESVSIVPAENLDLSTNSALKELKERCLNDLYEKCRELASERNINVANVMHTGAIKAMSEEMPESEEQMLSIPHVTKANFEKFGKEFLGITQNYAAEKLCLMMDLEEENNRDQNAAGPSNFDETNWAELANASSSTSSKGTGGKGKRQFRKFKSPYKRKRRTSKKAGAGTAAKKKTTAAAAVKRTAGKNNVKLLIPSSYKK